MSKLDSGKTITIKINGQKKSFLEEPEKNDQETAGDKNDISILDETNTENETISETAAAQETTDESFDWILPEPGSVQTELIEYKPANKTKGKVSSAFASLQNSKKGPIKSIILSVVFAIILGTSFGVLMLKLVVTEQGKTTKNTAAPAAVTEKSQPANTKNSAGSLKPLAAYMIQGGVFSSKEAVNEVAGKATEKEIPAQTIEMDGKYYLFLGVTDSLEAARAVGNSYRDENIEGAFPKALTIPEKNVENANQSEKNVLEYAASLFPLLTKATSNPTGTVTISTVDSKSISSLEASLKKIDSKKIKNKKINNLKVEISAAAQQVKNYQKQKDKKALVIAQQHLLSFLAVYYSF